MLLAANPRVAARCAGPHAARRAGCAAARAGDFESVEFCSEKAASCRPGAVEERDMLRNLNIVGGEFVCKNRANRWMNEGRGRPKTGLEEIRAPFVVAFFGDE